MQNGQRAQSPGRVGEQDLHKLTLEYKLKYIQDNFKDWPVKKSAISFQFDVSKKFRK